jgi:hypothetical protein
VVVVLLVLVVALTLVSLAALTVAGRCLARLDRIEEEFGWHERVHDHLVEQAMTPRATTS